MSQLEEMRRWTRFDEAHEAVLRDLWSMVGPRTPEIAERFYARIWEVQEARQVFVDESQVNRLRGTLQRWVHALLSGPWDEAWADQQRRIGEIHVHVGLPHRYMFTAMTVLRDQVCEIAREGGYSNPATSAAVGRVCEIALALMTGTFLDTHEQQQLSSLRDLLVSHLPAGVLVVDHQGLVRTATRSASWLTGTTSMVRRHYLSALPQELLEAVNLEQQVAHARATGNTITVLRAEVRLGGHPRTFRVDIVPFSHPIADFLIYIEELTPLIEADNRARRAEALAKVGALSAAVAHELRNPLAGMSGALQVLGRSLAADDPRKGVMEQVIRQVTRLDLLATDLLAFARPRATQLQGVDLFEAASEVARMTRLAWPSLDLVVAGAGRAVADPDLLQRVLLNLVTNGAQAVQGQGRVEIDIEGSRITVSDTGPGIPELSRTQVFQPFYTTKTQGTGLGLAISLQAVEAMQGSLQLVDSEVGARFQVTLPTPEEG